MNRPILFAALAVLAVVPPTPAHALSLEQAIGLARGNAPSLQAADASVSRAEHAIGQARAALSPRVSVAGSYVQNSEAPKAVFSIPGGGTQVVKMGSSNIVTARGEAQYTLSSGGRDAAQVEAAEAGRDGQLHARTRAEADLVLRVSEAYYRELAAVRLVGATQEALNAARSHFSLAAARVRAGVAPRLDQLRAQVDVSEREIAVARATEARRMARVELETAVGTQLAATESLDALREPGGVEPDSAEAWKSASETRPELGQLDEAIREAGRRAEAARAGLRPQVGVNAVAEYRGPNLDGNYLNLADPGLKTYNLSAGLSVSLPLLDGGLARERVGEAEAMRAQQEALRRETTLAIRRELARAFSSLRVARAVWQADSVRLDAAREGLRLSSEAYKGGSGTATDVRDAETSMANSAAEEAQSLADYWTARAQVEHAAGVNLKTKESGR